MFLQLKFPMIYVSLTSTTDHSVALQKAACIEKEAKCPMTSRNVIVRYLHCRHFRAINVTDFTDHKYLYRYLYVLFTCYRNIEITNHISA